MSHIERDQFDAITHDGKFIATADGGYPLLYAVYDNGSHYEVCAECANDVEIDHAAGESATITGADIYYEGPPLKCYICNKKVASAYGDPDEPDPGAIFMQGDVH